MSSFGDAVFFRSSDYASPGRRIGAFFIDWIVLLIALALLQGGLFALNPKAKAEWLQARAEHTKPGRHAREVATRAQRIWLFTFVLYHVAVRWTYGGTVGYRVMRIRMVNVHGEPPAFRSLLRRFVLACAGALPLGVTYVACIRNERRQAWHDRWASTWLVRRHAQPAGLADIEEKAIFLGSYMFTHQRLVPLAQVATPDPEGVQDREVGSAEPLV